MRKREDTMLAAATTVVLFGDTLILIENPGCGSCLFVHMLVVKDLLLRPASSGHQFC